LKGRVCVSNHKELQKMILDEGHESKFSIRLSLTKMYRNPSGG